MQLTVAHDFLPKSNTVRSALVMQHFGIGFEQGRHVIADNLEIPIQPGRIVLFTGDSGSGKSSLMREAARQLLALGQTVGQVDEQELGNHLLIDSLGTSFDDAIKLLSACGLGEAQLLLRRPDELSEGQRYRFRLALALARNPQWLVADEFTAMLDRTLARVISANLHKLSRRSRTGFLLATTHEDLLSDLEPDIHVRCRLHGGTRVIGHSEPDRKKKVSDSLSDSGFPGVPKPTGRISLGGIIAATLSPLSGT